MRSRDCPEEIVTTVVEALAEEGMQSDARFAESFVRTRIERGAGPLRVRSELMARGLDDDVIDAALAEYKGQWKDLARDVYVKRYGEQAPADYQERAKRMNFLQSRGFTAEQIHYAVTPKDSE